MPRYLTGLVTTDYWRFPPFPYRCRHWSVDLVTTNRSSSSSGDYGFGDQRRVVAGKEIALSAPTLAIAERGAFLIQAAIELIDPGHLLPWCDFEIELHSLDRLQERGVLEVVMESTAMYWRPVWIVLEPHVRLELAQAQSNRAPHGRKTDFGDAVRLVRRFWAGELRLSYVPDVEQRRWRMLCQAMQQIVEERTRVRNQIEVLLEEGQIKLSAVVSDLLGVSGWRILKALVEGQKTAAEMAEMAYGRLRSRSEELKGALEGSLEGVCRNLLDQALKRIEMLNCQEQEQRKWLGEMQREHASVLRRLGQVPGIDVFAAQKILAAVGPEAEAFPSGANLASWVGVCPGRNESAEHSAGNHCPKGYRPLRALIVQIAWAAVKTKGSFFQELFRRWVPRMGAKIAVWAIAHKLVRVIWCILHRRDTYVERGALPLNEVGRQRKKKRLLQALRALGYEVALNPVNEGAIA